MSLTKQDLTDIRTVILEALQAVVEPRFEDLETRFDNLETEFRNFKSEMTSFKADMTSFRAETTRRLSAIESQLTDMNGRLTALENDVMDIYKMLARKPTFGLGDKKYQKLSNNEKIQILDKEITNLAKHLNIPLSR